MAGLINSLMNPQDYSDPTIPPWMQGNNPGISPNGSNIAGQTFASGGKGLTGSSDPSISNTTQPTKATLPGDSSGASDVNPNSPIKPNGSNIQGQTWATPTSTYTNGVIDTPGSSPKSTDPYANIKAPTQLNDQSVSDYLRALMNAGMAPQAAIDKVNALGIVPGGNPAYYPDSNTIGLHTLYMDGGSGWGNVSRGSSGDQFKNDYGSGSGSGGNSFSSLMQLMLGPTALGYNTFGPQGSNIPIPGGNTPSSNPSDYPGLINYGAYSDPNNPVSPPALPSATSPTPTPSPASASTPATSAMSGQLMSQLLAQAVGH